MKIVVNRCFGGFGLSHAAVRRYFALKGIPFFYEVDEISKQVYGAEAEEKGLLHYGTQPDFMSDNNPGYWSGNDLKRDDPLLVQVVEELGKAANGACAQLGVVEIPDGVEWVIEEYDGLEHIAEAHRTW